MPPLQADVLVVGGGIIGTSIALALQREGHNVRLLDRKGIAEETSAGNAGAFAFSDIEPLATPGILRKAPKWLLDPLGPLSIPPRYALQIMPWMLRFWRASQQDRYVAACTAQGQLMDHCRAALDRQIEQVQGAPLILRNGQLALYEGGCAYRASLPVWQRRRAAGIDFDLLESAEAIAEIQPGLSPRFTHAGFTPTWCNTLNPKRWTEHLAQKFVAIGGTVMRADVRALDPSEAGVHAVTDQQVVFAKNVVIAAGAWSHHLGRSLGDHFPLETERGYNTTLPAGAFDLRTHLTFGAHGFVASAIDGGVRIGGAVELGGLSLPPNFRRAEVLLQKAKTFMPELQTSGGAQWMGFRPSLPDSLPVIDRSPHTDHVIYAFGHGHLGLTQSAGTAELVTQLVQGRPPHIDLTPFAADRF